MKKAQFWNALRTTALVSMLWSLGCMEEAPRGGANIEAQAPNVTFINVLQPNEASDQTEIARLLEEGLEDSIRDLPGFISASVHVSRDNDYVVVYAQWEQESDVEGAVALINAGGAPAMAEAFTRATPEFHPYDVTKVVLAP